MGGKITHGECRGYQRSSIYTTWRSMISRCKRKHDPRNKNYGGWGIVDKIGKKYRAYIIFDKKHYHIGMFEKPELAFLAYQSCKWVLENSTPN